MLVPLRHSRRQPYVILSLLSTANATALPATSGARGTECYRRSVGIVSLVVGLPFAPCLRELGSMVGGNSFLVTILQTVIQF